MQILILGASYGSLLGTKLAMAGHDVDLVCREATAKLMNDEGTVVRIKLRDEDEHRSISSKGLAGKVRAITPENVNAEDYDLVAMAMQEPQYGAGAVADLMGRIAAAKKPCLSIMNMPPMPYLKRIEALTDVDLTACYTAPAVWEAFEPGLVSLCSPDPQAFRPPEEGANVLHVGLPTNFKAATFAHDAHNTMLRQLETDIAAVTLDGNDVPVKLRVFDSLHVPLAKWSMLLTGNYRCVQADGEQAIRDAVHGDLERSRAIYAWVDGVVQKLGGDAADSVPFEKYAKAAEQLLKPSSAARAIGGGATNIERVDRLVQTVARGLGIDTSLIDDTVATVDARLAANSR
ncbi:ketopantoate reductase family protein [Ahrensia sp. R2A130]|uniref:ketopantoate reductase family protein n=1 Tax=Ahrensia sp. R2A130 TaxID=744979 RepID=UPI0001E0D885|nr:acetyl-CoA carboxylase [Ahrensia sp. R2A130]EFL87922.1 conserved hypothetical protein [Ahrensia sp. R2A130]